MGIDDGAKHVGCFNAARGFVGGAANRPSLRERTKSRFNAARGFVGGAAEGRVSHDR